LLCTSELIEEFDATEELSSAVVSEEHPTKNNTVIMFITDSILIIKFFIKSPQLFSHYIKQNILWQYISKFFTKFGVLKPNRFYDIILLHRCTILKGEFMPRKLITVLTVVLLLVITVIPSSAKAAENEDKVGKVKINSGWLNVRSSATADSEVLSTLKKDDYISLISRSGSWWKVEYAQNQFGYISSYYISEITAKTAFVNVSSGTLNVRSGAGSSYNAIDRLEKGKKIKIISTEGNWSFVLYDGTKVGYVSSWYLTDSITAYPGVSLSVPSFKQTDSRWANVTLGSSGKRMADIGCATTGIAMLESYRLGYTIYPDTMAKKLKYTQTGSVYWPSNYAQVTSKTDYLKRIYDKLKSGKPVLLGAKNKYGGQHWVVITGYLGGDTLTASKFTVNDPGSKNRKTLQDLFNTHPNFYKYLYY
jgi:uncharacterized protein YgiM (DUF1202 family)